MTARSATAGSTRSTPTSTCDSGGGQRGKRTAETSEVTYRLEPHEDGTSLTVTERQLPTTQSAQALSGLGAQLERGDVDDMGRPLGRCVEPGHCARDDWHPLIHRRRRTRVPTASSRHWPIQPGGNLLDQLATDGPLTRDGTGQALSDVAPGRRQAPRRPSPRAGCSSVSAKAERFATGWWAPASAARSRGSPMWKAGGISDWRPSSGDSRTDPAGRRQ